MPKPITQEERIEDDAITAWIEYASGVDARHWLRFVKDIRECKRTFVEGYLIGRKEK